VDRVDVGDRPLSPHAPPAGVLANVLVAPVYLQIYNDQIFDLLEPASQNLRMSAWPAARRTAVRNSGSL
jgi:hypothetical protein